jgi:hypothetical protein
MEARVAVGPVHTSEADEDTLFSSDCSDCQDNRAKAFPSPPGDSNARLDAGQGEPVLLSVVKKLI